MLLKNSKTDVASCFESYIEFSRCLVFSEFVFYFIFLNCRLVMVVFFMLWLFEIKSSLYNGLQKSKRSSN